ncbi:MAG: hypothetical protein Q9164_005074 [Protoblastenia rupestris]
MTARSQPLRVTSTAFTTQHFTVQKALLPYKLATAASQSTSKHSPRVDGDVFEDILRYLRSNSTGDPVYPLFYDQAKGFGYAIYQHILAQARYFDIPPLLEWIEGQKYLKAIEIERSTNILHRAEDVSTTHYANVRSEYYPIRRTEKVYVCPRGIDGHRGHQERCGRQCENAQRPDGKLYADEEVISFLEVQSKTVFKQSALTDET